MLNNFKKMFKDEKKKTENLIFFLVVLVISLILINRIIVDDDNTEEKLNDDNFQNTSIAQNDLEQRLQNILGKIAGVGNVEVLITYSESSSISPMYNETSSISISEEQVETGKTKTTETNESQKEILVDSSSQPIIEKSISPKIEGAIITAQGAGNSKVKTDIVSAVEAATGLATHKIQVFPMN